jgi:hypothetical protein
MQRFYRCTPSRYLCVFSDGRGKRIALHSINFDIGSLKRCSQPKHHPAMIALPKNSELLGNMAARLIDMLPVICLNTVLMATILISSLILLTGHVSISRVLHGPPDLCPVRRSIMFSRPIKIKTFLWRV